MVRQSSRRRRRVAAPRKASRSNNPSQGVTEEAIKTAEEVALAAFASGLKIVAAFGTVAAKTTSFALESLASGAGRFSELVKAEALDSSHKVSTRSRNKKRKK